MHRLDMVDGDDTITEPLHVAVMIAVRDLVPFLPAIEITLRGDLAQPCWCTVTKRCLEDSVFRQVNELLRETQTGANAVVSVSLWQKKRDHIVARATIDEATANRALVASPEKQAAVVSANYLFDVDGKTLSSIADGVSISALGAHGRDVNLLEIDENVEGTCVRACVRACTAFRCCDHPFLRSSLLPLYFLNFHRNGPSIVTTSTLVPRLAPAVELLLKETQTVMLFKKNADGKTPRELLRGYEQTVPETVADTDIGWRAQTAVNEIAELMDAYIQEWEDWKDWKKAGLAAGADPFYTADNCAAARLLKSEGTMQEDAAAKLTLTQWGEVSEQFLEH